MELRQLAYFEAVVRCGGFTRAADDLRIAQPAISAQVRSLERELGVRLLARTTRRVALTEAGELFLARARRVLGELDAARTEAGEVSTVVRGRVVVGSTGVLGGLDLPAALAGFVGRFPGVALSLRSGLVDALVDRLAAGDLDLVLGPLHDDRPAGVMATPLADDHLVAVTAPGSRRGRGPVGVADLAGEPFVCLPTGSGLRDRLHAMATAAGVAVDVRFEAATPGEVRDLVAAGLGVAVLAASATELPGPPVEVRQLRDAPAHPPFGVLHRDPLAPAARALHEHLLSTRP